MFFKINASYGGKYSQSPWRNCDQQSGAEMFHILKEVLQRQYRLRVELQIGLMTDRHYGISAREKAGYKR
jgi:hypothetical protein